MPALPLQYATFQRIRGREMGKYIDKLKNNKSKIIKISNKIAISLFMYMLLIGLAFVFLYPFLYMIFTSFKSTADLNDISVKWILNEWRWENYKTAFGTLKYQERLFNTAFVVLASVFGHILSCSFVGYGFARFEFRFKKLWFALLLLAIIIPTETPSAI